MVKDEVWDAAQIPSKGLACLKCLEKRLKRRVILDDFWPCILTAQYLEDHKKEFGLKVVTTDFWGIDECDRKSN